MDDVKRLLIVDDEETLTFSLYQTFINAPMECEVVTVDSGDAAWERFSQKPFDVVITDIAMPGMNGLELLKKIKEARSETKVVVITAYGSDERQEKANFLGAEEYIEKPFDIRELKKIIIQMFE